nr:AlNc14C277G10055 [Albugo laibachii Nc14]CCA25764.1 AlNc14C320G10576 [Albugo laibachii Nc14]|eukprot:CCA25764.1 AlNc14C320G10576 [Albugo laibachii Nc14]
MVYIFAVSERIGGLKFTHHARFLGFGALPEHQQIATLDDLHRLSQQTQKNSAIARNCIDIDCVKFDIEQGNFDIECVMV